jgi:hypothetical protein
MKFNQVCPEIEMSTMGLEEGSVEPQAPRSGAEATVAGESRREVRAAMRLVTPW